jgi:hypothetical protein
VYHQQPSVAMCRHLFPEDLRPPLHCAAPGSKMSCLRACVPGQVGSSPRSLQAPWIVATWCIGRCTRHTRSPQPTWIVPQGHSVVAPSHTSTLTVHPSTIPHSARVLSLFITWPWKMITIFLPSTPGFSGPGSSCVACARPRRQQCAQSCRMAVVVVVAVQGGGWMYHVLAACEADRPARCNVHSL